MAQQTFSGLAAASLFSGTQARFRFDTPQQFDAALTGGVDRFLYQLVVNRSTNPGNPGVVALDVTASAGPSFSDGQDLGTDFETGGEITLAYGPESVTFFAPNRPGVVTADPTERYVWRPAATTIFDALIDAVAANSGLANSILFDDNTGSAPLFSDPTGDDISGDAGTPIVSVTIPEADGDPEPTYAVVGSLPSGLSFDTTTRVLSGTPLGGGSGTITIRATNSEGTADWTADYDFTGTPVITGRAVSIRGIRGRGGDLYWKVGRDDWRAFQRQDGLGGPSPRITFTKGEGWTLVFFGEPLPGDVTIGLARAPGFPLVSETIPVGTVATPMNAPVLEVTTSGETTINASWDAVTGADGYEYRTGTSGSWTATTDTMASITGLEPGTEYTIQVRATSADDDFDSPGPVAQQVATTGEDVTILYGVSSVTVGGFSRRVLRMDPTGNATLFATLPSSVNSVVSLCRVGTGVLFVDLSGENFDALWASDLTAAAIAAATQRTNIYHVADDRAWHPSVIGTSDDGGYILYQNGDLFPFTVSTSGVVTRGTRVGRASMSGVVRGFAVAPDGTAYATANRLVYTIDLTNATATLLGTLPDGVAIRDGLAYSGNPVGLAAGENNLYAVGNTGAPRLWRWGRTEDPATAVERGIVAVGGNNEGFVNSLDVL